jgi:hypothetical protein
MKNIKDIYASLVNYSAMDQVYDNNHLNTGLNLEKSKLVKVEQEQVMQLNELSTKQQDFHNSESIIEKLISEKEDRNKLKSTITQYLADYEDKSEITASNIDQLIGDLLDSTN